MAHIFSCFVVTTASRSCQILQLCFTAFEARQQNTAQQQQNMATPEGSGPPPGTSSGSGPPLDSGISVTLTIPPQGAAVTTAGEHMSALHIVG